ncbi:hypothetical protein [Nocardia brasiliensis]
MSAFVSCLRVMAPNAEVEVVKWRDHSVLSWPVSASSTVTVASRGWYFS